MRMFDVALRGYGVVREGMVSEVGKAKLLKDALELKEAAACFPFCHVSNDRWL